MMYHNPNANSFYKNLETVGGIMIYILDSYFGRESRS